MASDLKSHVLTGCRTLLRPVVRLLLKSGITWKEFADLSKSVFVQVATEEFGIRGRPTNGSRVAILTGINRHEIARQRELLAAGDDPAGPAYAGSATRVLSGWHQDPDYLDAGGRPAEISRDGAAPSFADLCGRYAGDIPATALLKELQSAGAVTRQGTRVRALMRHYVPVQFDAEKMAIGASLLRDHADTVVYDLTRGGGDAARLARRAHNARVDARALPAFRKFLEREGQAFLERVDDWLTQHEAPADAQERALVRVGAGVYQIQDEIKRGVRT
jgi:hypothetical protein